MLFTGARRSEVPGLTWDHVDLAQLTVRFAGAKGGKTRAVPLAETAVEALREGQLIRPRCDHRCVFTTQQDARLDRRDPGTCLMRALEGAGIEAHVTPCPCARPGSSLIGILITRPTCP